MIYAISDLHLSTNTDKSMEVFGERWAGYMDKIRSNWLSQVSESDTVIIGGDVSWEMRLADCKGDFGYINSLPGRKIILKGNHDYWWETAAKMNSFVRENEFENIEFINNNAFEAEGVAICGTRWWLDPTSDEFSGDDRKIYDHELIRLEASLKEAAKLNCDNILAALHFPPFDEKGNVNGDIAEIFAGHSVTKCIYGHLHGVGHSKGVEGVFGGVKYHLTSSDFLQFTPKKITFEKN